jgi:hypothetical protein
VTVHPRPALAVRPAGPASGIGTESPDLDGHCDDRTRPESFSKTVHAR